MINNACENCKKKNVTHKCFSTIQMLKIGNTDEKLPKSGLKPKNKNKNKKKMNLKLKNQNRDNDSGIFFINSRA